MPARVRRCGACRSCRRRRVRSTSAAAAGARRWCWRMRCAPRSSRSTITSRFSSSCGPRRAQARGSIESAARTWRRRACRRAASTSCGRGCRSPARVRGRSPPLAPAADARGCLAASECSWLVAEPPAAAAAFFREGYPGMAGIEANIDRARAAERPDRSLHAATRSVVGRVLHAPGAAHGAPRARRRCGARRRARRDPTGDRAIPRHGDSYGYVFYLLRQRH